MCTYEKFYVPMFAILRVLNISKKLRDETRKQYFNFFFKKYIVMDVLVNI